MTNQNASDLELINTPVRLYRVQRELIEKAAALEPGRALADYMREILVKAACHDLHVAEPATPPIRRGRHGSLVAQAASKLGMSQEEFERQASRMLAANVLQPEAATVERRDSGFYTPQRAPSAKPSKRKAR